MTVLADEDEEDDYLSAIAVVFLTEVGVVELQKEEEPERRLQMQGPATQYSPASTELQDNGRTS